MSNTTETPTEIIDPKRRGRLADFFIRLVKEKPLGTISGIIILILIFVAIFTEVLAPYPFGKYTRQTGCRAHQPDICWEPTSWGETS